MPGKKVTKSTKPKNKRHEEEEIDDLEEEETEETDEDEEIEEEEEQPAPAPRKKDPAYKLRQELQQEREKSKDYEAKLKKIEEDKLRGNNKWKEIADLKEKELEQERTKNKAMQDSQVKNAINSEVRTEAVKAGINPQALNDLDLLDFPEIDTETPSNGKIIVHGAKEAVAALKQQRPHWFGVVPPSINPASPETRRGAGGKGGSKTVSGEDVMKARQAYKATPTKENLKKYEDALTAFQEAQASQN